jgi:hypothetical protein
MEKQIEKDIAEMLEILDADITNTESDINILNELRGYLVSRDEKNMLRLLYAVRSIIQNRQDNQAKRFNVRRKLAQSLGCAVEKLTLSKLCDYIEEPFKAAIAERRNVLVQIVERFKTEYEATVFLLSDCARFNSLLLRSLVDFGSAESTTYKPGKVNRVDSAAFINTQY